MSMADKRVLCEPCLFVETEIEAVGFCMTCAECLCSKCVTDHRKTKVTRTHEVQKDSIPDNVGFIKELNEMITCQIHKEMKISYRCNDHSVCICTVCCVDTHMNCKHVIDVAKCEALDKDLVSLEENLDDLKLSTTSLKDKRENNRKALYQCRVDILREHKDVIKKTINTLEEIQTNFEKETDQKLQDAVSDINDTIESIELIEKSVDRHTGIIEAAKKYGDSSSPKIICQQLVDSVRKERNLLEDIDNGKEYKLMFLKNEDCIQVSPLGKLSVIYGEESQNKRENSDLEKTSDEATESEASSSIQVKTSENESISYSPTISRKSAYDKKQQIKVSVNTDKHLSSIYGISILSDGRLVIIDYANSNIKLLTSNYKVLSSLELPARPISVCCIGNYEVAVSFQRLKRIDKYRVAGHILLFDGGFPTHLFNHGLGFDGNSIVALMCDVDFACYNNARHNMILVKSMNPYNGMTNSMISEFRVEGIRPWSRALRNTQALRFTQEGNMVIAELNRVFSFGVCAETFHPPLSFQKVAVENDFYVGEKEDVKDKFENIAIDSRNVFVCTSSGCVLQLCAHDFSKNRVIIRDPDEVFTAIAVDEKNGRLILGCRGKDKILVYETV